MEEEEAWVEKATQLLPSLAGFLTTLEDYVGVSFEYPLSSGTSCGGEG